jgi:hypothetical protein
MGLYAPFSLKILILVKFKYISILEGLIPSLINFLAKNWLMKISKKFTSTLGGGIHFFQKCMPAKICKQILQRDFLLKWKKKKMSYKEFKNWVGASNFSKTRTFLNPKLIILWEEKKQWKEQ